ncbi:hypothetical protein OKW24_003893 [Peribacillus simplex]|uniref:putative immunity protein n=1 Tax=Peribacillus simplex TaxID=1478 RepID=UPI0024E1ECD1|nr:hypothetical protein [Peribacillus simplex]MDF9762120.1 hypothetical protein [Peribacillus simplex]
MVCPNPYLGFIEEGQAWLKGESSVGEKQSCVAAHAAARKADDKATVAAARPAGHAVAKGHMFSLAIHASTYAAKSVEYTNDLDITSANERARQYLRFLGLYEFLKEVGNISWFLKNNGRYSLGY